MPTRNAEIIRLADMLLSDLETSTSFDLILAKAYRLAESAGNAEAITWLSYELNGYDSSTALGKKYARLTQRWDGASDKGYFQSATDVASKAESMGHTLQVHKEFVPSGQYAGIQHPTKLRRSMSGLKRLLPCRRSFRR